MHAPISADAISHRRCPTTGKPRIHEKRECTPWGCTTRKYRVLSFEIVLVFPLNVLSAVTQTILRDFSPAEYFYYIKKPRRGASIPPRTDASDNPLSASAPVFTVLRASRLQLSERTGIRTEIRLHVPFEIAVERIGIEVISKRHAIYRIIFKIRMFPHRIIIII